MCVCVWAGTADDLLTRSQPLCLGFSVDCQLGSMPRKNVERAGCWVVLLVAVPDANRDGREPGGVDIRDVGLRWWIDGLTDPREKCQS